MKNKLLFICSGGLDRSPTAVDLFKDSQNYEARSIGIMPLISAPVTRQALIWADYIFCMEHEHKVFILENFPLIIKDKPEIIVLNVPNEYVRTNPELEKILRNKLEGWLK
jgi:predicted protein tyrosine phosphatase